MKIGETRPARRLLDGAKEFDEGDYSLFSDRSRCWLWPPGARGVGSIKFGGGGHGLEEHADGSITVRGSILFTGGAADGTDWHGFLEGDVWRRV